MKRHHGRDDKGIGTGVGQCKSVIESAGGGWIEGPGRQTGGRMNPGGGGGGVGLFKSKYLEMIQPTRVRGWGGV